MNVPVVVNRGPANANTWVERGQERRGEKRRRVNHTGNKLQATCVKAAWRRKWRKN